MRANMLRFSLHTLFAVCLFGMSTSSALAARVFVSPSSLSVKAGDQGTLTVYLDAEGTPVNSADITLSFSNDTIQVTGVSKAGSIFSLWIEEPDYSNADGTIHFNGGLPSPGYAGSQGKLLTVSFIAKKAGATGVSFVSSSVTANDGEGTNVLRTTAPSQITVREAAPSVQESKQDAKPVTTEPTSSAQSTPVIRSESHPKQDAWYAVPEAEMSWSSSKEVTGVRLSIGKSSATKPSVLYRPAISSKHIDDLDDGIWYFAVQQETKDGWGTIGRYELRVDTAKPSIKSLTFKDAETVSDKQRIVIDAGDKLSGVDRYEISVDGGKAVVWEDDGSHTYAIPQSGGGEHTVLVTVYDKAGNAASESLTFTGKQVLTPVILEYSRELTQGSPITIRGTASPNSQVMVWLKKDDDAARVRVVDADEEGRFIFKSLTGAEIGVYTAWAEMISATGVKSAPSETIMITVAESAFMRGISKINNLLALTVPFIALVLLLGVVLLYGLRHLRMVAHKAEAHTHAEEVVFREAFIRLRELIRQEVEQFKIAKGDRALTAEEKKLLTRLGSGVTKTETAIKRALAKKGEE